MPYLHTQEYLDHKRLTESRYDENTRREYVNRGQHPRRGLDEIRYEYHSKKELSRRNKDQVMTKYMKHANERGHQTMILETSSSRPVTEGKTELIVTDQLWLWILDPDTNVTSFPGSSGGTAGQPCNVSCPHLHCECLIVERIDKTKGYQNAQQLSSHIVEQCSRLVLESRGKMRRHQSDGVVRDSIVDLFRKYIAQKRAICGKIFDDFETKVIGKTNEPRDATSTEDHLNITNDIGTVGEVRDAIEELEMILHVVDEQQRALETARYSTIESVVGIRQSLENLRHQAKDVHEMLFKTLDLKQTQLSIHQNKLVLVFTIVTIVFVPLSFISSIFGMNASELSDGSPLHLGRIFLYMFPISFALSVIVLSWAFWFKDRDATAHVGIREKLLARNRRRTVLPM